MTNVEIINLVFNAIPRKAKPELLGYMDGVSFMIGGRAFRIDPNLYVEEIEGRSLVCGESAQQIMTILKRRARR